MRSAAAVLLLCVGTAAAFAPRPIVMLKTTTLKAPLTQVAAILPEHGDAMSAVVSQFQHFSSIMLTDAAVADATDAVQESGWWSNYLGLFKSFLSFIHATIDQPLRDQGITQTWGISIAIFTAVVRSVLIPISVQQTKSAEYTKALKPYMTEIKAKFKDNQEAQNRAISKLFEDAKQNPLSGCLLSIVQLPVLLGLYRGIRLLAMDGDLQEPFLWIPSLEGPVTAPKFQGMDWLTTGWTTVDGSFLPVPQMGWETTIAFLIMPVLLVLGQSLTMNVLSPSMVDDSMTDEEKEQMEKTQGILKFLPLMIGYFSLQVPAGLTIYWFTSNVFSLTQSLVVKAYYAANPPKIELPEYWDALDNLEDMTPEQRRSAAEAGISTAPKFSQLLEEANFHYVVQRSPLRAQSAAWKRVESGSRTIPTELEDWVNSASSTA